MSNRRPDDAASLRFREYLPTLDTFYAERTEQLRRNAQKRKLELLQRAEQKRPSLSSLLSGSAPNAAAPSIGC